MKERFLPGYMVTILMCLLSVTHFGQMHKPSSTQKIRLTDGYCMAGFEENSGQIINDSGRLVPEVFFRVLSNGLVCYITRNGVTLVQGFTDPKQREACFRTDLVLLSDTICKDQIIKEQPLNGEHHYFLPHCPDGILHVRSYQKLTVRNIFPGIDWVFMTREKGEIEHEFIVHPGADVSAIRFQVRWADVALDENHQNLRLSTPAGMMEDGPLKVWQEDDTHRSQMIRVDYQIDDQNVICFSAGKEYDPECRMVIDPSLKLIWSTFYGGRSADYLMSHVTDHEGNLFLTGFSSSVNFPVQAISGNAYFQDTLTGNEDMVILKFDPDGMLLWATFYGGEGTDQGISLDITQDGDVIVAGNTSSTQLPVLFAGAHSFFQATNAGASDLAILKFSGSGIRKWATYFGGNGQDEIACLKINSGDQIFLTGTTISTNIPVKDPGGGVYFQPKPAGERDLFIAGFSDSCSLFWSTCYGGSYEENSRGLAIDSDDHLLVTGYTCSGNFPVQQGGADSYNQLSIAGEQDAFILRFDQSGYRLWAVFYGGIWSDQGTCITIDGSDNLFVAGETTSPDFPLKAYGADTYLQNYLAGYHDIFILKFNKVGVRYWATYYGGTQPDQATGLCVGPNGDLYLCGISHSDDFPLYDPGEDAYFQSFNAGDADNVLLKFSNSGSRLWSTFQGGASPDFARGISVEPTGDLMVSGYTVSANFPLQDPGIRAFYQKIHGGGWSDGFISRFEGFKTAIESRDPVAGFRVFPNPAQTGLGIYLQEQIQDPVILELYDMNGRLILQRTYSGLQSGPTVIPIGFLPPGVCHLRLITPQYSHATRVIILP